MSFVHLHVHSEYSLLDGLSHIPQLIERTKQLNMPAIALTDHGTMFGAIEFYRAAKAAGVKPIIGIEAYLAQRTMADRDPQKDSRPHHLLLLAENDLGYKNLLQIASAAQLEGFYYRPRIDREFLAAHNQGLICTTGCLSAEVPRAVLRGDQKRARERLDWYYDVFGADRFFFELQSHAIPELETVNRGLMDLAPHYQGRFVATNDVHYITPEDAVLQDIMLCIQTGSVRSDPDRMRMPDGTFYLRDPEEMRTLFGSVPGALENTLLIAERCEVDLDFKGYRLPRFDVPEGDTADSFLRRHCEEGLTRRYAERAGAPEIRQRLDYELNVIHQMGFDTYFLIVWDLCRYAREHEIWYNARGSAAGSIVAYCLGITLVDPLQHGLMFERFLNPSRVSMPDIDLDFQDDKRHQVLEYTAQKYGQDKVAQIITFGTLGARAAIRDVGRVLDIPLPEVDRVAKMVPNVPGKPVLLADVLAEVPSFREAYDSAPYLKDLIDTAQKLEGTVRNAGTHAAGVIITDQPITEYLPLHRPTRGGPEDNPVGAVTQYEMQVLESLGLLKIDFLGLSTLTVMERACAKIRQRHGVELDIDHIPVDDPLTFELLGRGEVLGVFQVEGAGMRRYLVEMKPKEVANVIAMVALYRPGPLEFIPTYIRRMHGEEAVSYRDPALEPVFRETFGIPVYQEQIMSAAMQLAGYTASEADDLRKAIAKKKAEQLTKHRRKFIEGAIKAGMKEGTAGEIFDDWENFARYGFNKAHAADYGVIAVQTAYLKAHYPIEYMTALMSVFRGDTAKVALYMADCRRMGFEVLPPDINASGLDFEIEDRPGQATAIRYGLAAIKNVGEGAVQAILDARANAPFRDLNDVATRVDLRQVGKRALESLVRVGAFDSLGARLSILENLDRVLAVSNAHFRAKEVGQLTMFGSSTGVQQRLELPAAEQAISRRQQLGWEKELLGLYVSDHPLTPMMEDLTQVVSHFSAELNEVEQGQNIVVAGMVTHVRPYRTRTGKEMGFVSLEDLQGTIELVVFSRVWADAAGWLAPDKVVLVKGRVDLDRGDPKVLVDEIGEDFTLASAASSPLPYSSLEAGPENGDESGPPAFESVAMQDMPLAPANPARPASSPAGARPRSPHARPEAASVPSVALVEHAVGAPAAVLLSVASAPRGRSSSIRHKLTVVLKSTGDHEKDARRMRRVHGILTSYPGEDRFAFQVHESARQYLLEFPSLTTRLCDELLGQLRAFLGDDTVRVESFQT